MKVETNKTKGFDPITLTITIESEQELLDLYARTLSSKTKVNAGICNSENRYADNSSCVVLYNLLEKLINDFEFSPVKNESKWSMGVDFDRNSRLASIAVCDGSKITGISTFDTTKEALDGIIEIVSDLLPGEVSILKEEH